jgi:hypothetical protein
MKERFIRSLFFCLFFSILFGEVFKSGSACNCVSGYCHQMHCSDSKKNQSCFNHNDCQDLTTITSSSILSTNSYSTNSSCISASPSFSSNCSEEIIIEICTVTRYINNTAISEQFDCYELSMLCFCFDLYLKTFNFIDILKKDKEQKREELQASIEKKRDEQLSQIQNKTQEELKKLAAKYSVTDKVGTSFAVLAYAFIGLFILFVISSDFIKLFKFFWNKVESLYSNTDLKGNKIGDHLNLKNKLITRKDQDTIDPTKLKDLDKRIFKLQLEYSKSLREKV